MHLRFLRNCLSALLLFSSITLYAQGRRQKLEIYPPHNGPSATVFKQPGFNYKTCPHFTECKVIDWIDKGEIITSIDRIKANGEFYIMAKFQTTSGEQIGFVQESYTRPVTPETLREKAVITTKQETLKSAKQKPEECETNVNAKGLTRKIEEAAMPAAKNEVPREEAIEIIAMKDPEKFNDLCKNFIDEFGSEGAFGTKISAAIPKIGQQCFMNELDVSPVCPKFNNFSNAKKVKFWSYVLASKARIESSCDKKATGQGPYDTAVGLFQLERSVERRRKVGRDSEWCKTKKWVDPYNVDFQIECSLSILRDWHCGSTKRKITDGYGYWQELRGRNGKISQLIKQFPGCKK